MTTAEYGPVPVSRIKEEAGAIFHALESQQRVLVSRHGRVVAAIEPASPERHADSLIAFALASNETTVRELSATEIGQGSPSEAVRSAAAGRPALVTRGGKVYGVLGASRMGESLADVDRSEDMLAEFEREHPDASFDDFAAASDEVAAGGPARRVAAHEDWAGTLVDALLVRGLEYKRRHDVARAAETFERAISRFGSDPDDGVRIKVARTKVELARIYAEEEHPAGDPMRLADEAIQTLDSNSMR